MTPKPYSVESLRDGIGMAHYRIVTPAGPTPWRYGDEEYQCRLETQVDGLNNAYDRILKRVKAGIPL